MMPRHLRRLPSKSNNNFTIGQSLISAHGLACSQSIPLNLSTNTSVTLFNHSRKERVRESSHKVGNVSKMIQQSATRLWDGYIYPALKKLIVRALA